jgi:hypothetical protein
MRRVRISLRGLLLLVTAIGLFLGAREWRRQSVLKLCEEIKYDPLLGIYVTDFPNDWRDSIWQSGPVVLRSSTKDGQEFFTAIIFRSSADIRNLVYDKPTIDRAKELGVIEYK